MSMEKDIYDQKLYSLVYGDFSRLVVSTSPKKLRRCLKCSVKFVSNSYGKRFCGSCAAQNQRAARRSAEVYDSP